MKPTFPAATMLLVLGSLPAFAQGQAKNCNELKTEIAAKIEANGVKNYDLTIINNDEVKAEDKVVGSCGGGTKKIVYLRKDDSGTK